MKKKTRYVSNANHKITIQRGKNFREYYNISGASRKRLNEILSHYDAIPCKTSYGTTLYYLWII